MNIFEKAIGLFGRKSATPVSGFANIGGVSGVYGGEPVTQSSTLGLSAVWSCVNLISGTISSLPFPVYRTNSDGWRDSYDQHPLYHVLNGKPNSEQVALDFWDFMCISLELHGNAFARIERIDGRVVALWPIKPDAITVKRRADGVIEYRWTEGGQSRFGTEDNIFHIRGIGGDPLGGMSPLQFGRKTFSGALSADRAASLMFANGMRPSGIVTFKEWLTPEQREISERRLTEKYVGAQNSGKPFIAEGGMTYEAISVSPVDAQMLESRNFSVEEICRFFGVPPVLIGHAGGTTAWPTSVEQQQLIFQTFTLRRRLKRIEQAVKYQLMTPDDRARSIVAEFNIEGLLRGDSASRATFYESGLRNGWLMINEVRGLENKPRVNGGDTPRTQMQNVPITDAGTQNGAGQ